jgi:hypothetical protein
MVGCWILLTAGIGSVAGTAPGTLGGALVMTFASVGVLSTGMYVLARGTTLARGDAEDWNAVVADAKE